MAKSALLKSSLAKKYWMAASGLFLCLFLVGHLLGNFQLMIKPVAENGIANIAQEQFNFYAHFMTTNPLVKVLSYVTYLSILFHAVDGILLTIQNKKARPVDYVKNNPSANSVWTSRYMGILGTLILVFIIIHMYAFWGAMHFRLEPNYVLVDGTIVKDLYPEVFGAFKNSLGYTLLYVVCMFPIGFHLSHGFASAFQTFGLNHKKYNSIIKYTGLAFSILVPAAFAIIPLYIHFIL